jgi:hypothetical protein
MRLPVLCAAALVAACASGPGPSTDTTPDPFAVIAVVPLTNPGLESGKRGPHGDPEGWSAVQHAGESSYRFTVDADVRHDGARSMRIDNIGREPFGALEQVVPAEALRGKTIRFSGWLKTRDANGRGAALIASAEASGAIVAHDYMTDREVTGTRDWRKYALTLKVPPHAGNVHVGVMMMGTGSVWFDDPELEIVAPR